MLQSTRALRHKSIQNYAALSPSHRREALAHIELEHPSLTELIVTQDMHTRKAAMAQRSDAFIALPGGIGTLEEFFEVFTWTQLGLHHKPLGILNVEGYYDTLLSFLDSCVQEGFVKQTHRDLILCSEDPGELLEHLATARVEYEPKWVDPL